MNLLNSNDGLREGVEKYSTPQEYYKRSCECKKRYRSQQDAEATMPAKRLERPDTTGLQGADATWLQGADATWHPLVAYKCRFCDKWHVGHYMFNEYKGSTFKVGQGKKK
jgi:hypothetical protein